MKHRLVIRALILVLLASGTFATAGEEYDGAFFKRFTLVVSDIDRSLQVYRDSLGFELDGISESGEDSYSYPVFRIDPEAKVRFATLSAGTEQVRTMALTEIKGMDLPKPGRPLMSAAVIRVNDIDGVMAKIEELGLEVVEQKIAGRPGEFTFKEQAFVDFDGHLIVLYQILEVASE